jgi:hypothetical protein
MGLIPYRVHDVCKKKLGVYWGLVDKISNLSRLRVEKLGCAGSSSRPWHTMLLLSWVLGGIDNRRCAEALQAVSSWAVSSLYLLPKAVFSALASLCPFPVTASSCLRFSSLYLPKTAFAALANLQSEDLTL